MVIGPFNEFKAETNRSGVIKIMDFKPTKYKKGELVQFFRRSDETLGIVKGHDGGKVEVEWVKWPAQVRPGHGWYPMYKVQRVTQD